MKKSIFLEVVEWCVLAAVVLFFVGVMALRQEIISNPADSPLAPRYSLQEE